MAPIVHLLPVLLAHQGGWDELLMVAAPIAIFAVLLRAANRRAARLGEGDGEQDESEIGTLGGPAPRNERRGPI